MRYIVTVRGTLKGSNEDARKAHDAIVAKIGPAGKQMGNTSHQPYLNVQNNHEFLSVDFWTNLEAIQKLYSDPNLAAEFATMFEGQPQVTIWGDDGWMQF